MWTTPLAKRVLGANAPGDTVAAAVHARMSPYDTPAVAGTNPYEGALGIYETKTAAAPKPPSPAQIATADATPRLIRHFESAHKGVITRRVGLLVSRELDWLAARPTALTSDGGLLIITTTREDLASEWFTPYGPEHHRMPPRITTRVLHDLMVTGASHAYVVCEIQGRESNEIVERFIGRDEATIELAMASLFDAEQEFWIRHYLHRRPPAPTPGDKELLVKRLRLATTRDLTATREQMADLLLRSKLKAQIKDLTAQVTAIEVSLMHAMGDARALLAPDAERDEDKTRLVKYDNTAQFAEATFREDQPELAQRHSAEQKIQVLDVPRLAEAEPELTAPYFCRPFTPARSGKVMALLDAAARSASLTGEVLEVAR